MGISPGSQRAGGPGELRLMLDCPTASLSNLAFSLQVEALKIKTCLCFRGHHMEVYQTQRPPFPLQTHREQLGHTGQGSSGSSPVTLCFSARGHTEHQVSAAQNTQVFCGRALGRRAQAFGTC